MSDEKLRDRRKAAIADKNNPEWTEADFARAKPASEVLGSDAAAALVRPRGRPAKAPEERKRQVTMRLSPDVLKAARATGPGWQTRADAALRREFVPIEKVAARSSVKTTSLGELVRSAAKKAKTVTIERVTKTGQFVERGRSPSKGHKKRA